jgi:hypothetical protein
MWSRDEAVTGQGRPKPATNTTNKERYRRARALETAANARAHCRHAVLRRTG